MTTPQTRVARGILAGGQFAADLHAEPSITLSDPAALANLNRPIAKVTLSEEQIQSLRRHKTPIKDAAARRGVADIHIDLSATDAGIRAIRERLNGG
jgi:hypothetical protein